MESGLDALIYRSYFGANRAKTTANKLASDGEKLSGAARLSQTAVTATQLADSIKEVGIGIVSNTENNMIKGLAQKTTSNLTNITGKVTQNCSDDAINFVGKSFDAIKGFGLGANLLYAGAKACEQDDVIDGSLVGFSGVGAMYAAENAYEKGIVKVLDKIGKIKINESETKGIMKIATKLSKINLKGKLGQIVKGVGFICASCGGMYAGEKIGEFVAKH